MIRNRILNLLDEYPRQFWLLFVGLMISITGASMIWPFLMIYVSERLALPLRDIAWLMTINSVMSLIASFVAGPITDKAGRKWVMVISLVFNGLTYLGLSRADTFVEFALVMAISGAFNPLYRVGADAMLADLIPQEKRIDGYSLLRTSNNIGVALGPMIGGVLASSSYTLAFYGAALGMATYGFLVAFLARETLPARSELTRPVRERFGGYGRVLRNQPFMSFVTAFTLTTIGAVLIWVLMAVYAKQNFGIPESRYGLIPTTNALMVIVFQYGVTQFTKRRRPLLMLALGSLLYAGAVGSVGLATGYLGFWLSMVVMTVGELILSPTATTLAANMAPPDMRGRYMSIYGVTWNVAYGIGPVYGGLLNDLLGPQFIWFGGALVVLIGVAGFLLMAHRAPHPAPAGAH